MAFQAVAKNASGGGCPFKAMGSLRDVRPATKPRRWRHLFSQLGAALSAARGCACPRTLPRPAPHLALTTRLDASHQQLAARCPIFNRCVSLFDVSVSPLRRSPDRQPSSANNVRLCCALRSRSVEAAMSTSTNSMADLAKLCPFMSSDPKNPEPEPESLCPFASAFGFASPEPTPAPNAKLAEACPVAHNNVAPMGQTVMSGPGKFSSAGALMSQTARGNAMAHGGFGNTMRRTLKTSAVVEDSATSAAHKQSEPLTEKMTLRNAPKMDISDDYNGTAAKVESTLPHEVGDPTPLNETTSGGTFEQNYERISVSTQASHHLLVHPPVACDCRSFF